MTAPHDSLVAFQWRRLKTGLCWAIFGLGGLGLSMTYFPYLRLTVNDPIKRRLMARAMIARSFNFFADAIRWLDVAAIDRVSLAKMRTLRGSIIIANHPTILDYVLIASMLPEMDCLVKASLRHNFFLKHVIRAADYMSNGGSADTLDEIARRLKAGENILIFPEGTRTTPGVPIKLKRGVAHASLRTGCPLAVVHIKCSHAWLTKQMEWYEIPPVKPSITLSFEGMIEPQAYVRAGEEGFSLASRRLTEAMRRELLKASGREHEIEG